MNDEAPEGVESGCDAFEETHWQALTSGTLEPLVTLKLRHHATGCDACKTRLHAIDTIAGMSRRKGRVGTTTGVLIQTVVTSIHQVGESLKTPSRLLPLVAVLGALAVLALVWPVADKALEDESGKPVMLSHDMLDAMVAVHEQNAPQETLRPWLERGIVARIGPGDRTFWASPEGTRLDPERSKAATVLILKSPPVTLSEGLADSLQGGAVGEEIRGSTLVRMTRGEGKLVLVLKSPQSQRPSPVSSTP